MLGYINPEHSWAASSSSTPRGAGGVRRARSRGRSACGSTGGLRRALVAASNMIRAIRAVSSERGRDPREFACSPSAATARCSQSAWPRARDHARRGAAVGRPVLRLRPALADVEHHYVRSFRGLLRAAGSRPSTEAFAEGSRGRRGRSSRPRAWPPRRSPGSSGGRLAMHYQGQIYELTVPVPDGPITRRPLRRPWRRPSARSTSGPTAIARARPSRSSSWRSSSWVRACAKAVACRSQPCWSSRSRSRPRRPARRAPTSARPARLAAARHRLRASPNPRAGSPRARPSRPYRRDGQRCAGAPGRRPPPGPARRPPRPTGPSGTGTRSSAPGPG